MSSTYPQLICDSGPADHDRIETSSQFGSGEKI
jgi:hypothetical protein